MRRFFVIEVPHSGPIKLCRFEDAEDAAKHAQSCYIRKRMMPISEEQNEHGNVHTLQVPLLGHSIIMDKAGAEHYLTLYDGPRKNDVLKVVEEIIKIYECEKGE